MTKIFAWVVGALAIALIAVSTYAWGLRADNAKLAANNRELTNDRSALNVDMRECKSANTGWQAALDNVQASLKACVGTRDDASSKAAAAVDASRAQEARLAAELSAWREKFRAASKAPDCAAAMEARLCPSVLDY